MATIDQDTVPELVISLVKKDRGQPIPTRGQGVIIDYELADQMHP